MSREIKNARDEGTVAGGAANDSLHDPLHDRFHPKWFAIVNPVAGGGRGLDAFPHISKLLRDNGIPCEPVFTEHKCHATELTVEAVTAGYRRIIVIGGDGTLHEVVNGLFIQQCVRPDEISLAVIAVGTGNDWIRMFGITENFGDAIRAIREEHTFLQDVCCVKYVESQFEQTRYMANVAGIGLDAYVIGRYNHWRNKGRSGPLLYVRCLLRSFFRYRSSGVKVWVDDRPVYDNLLLSAAFGVCQYNGGGIRQLPKAVPDDGLLDVTLIRPLYWWQVVFRLRKLFNGNIYTIGHVHHAQGRHVRIESIPSVQLEVDGEMLGGSPVEFSIVPRAVRVVVSRSFIERHKTDGR